MAEPNGQATRDRDLMAQQGDVLFWRAEIPRGAKKTTRRAVAEGEVTGHAHRVATEDAEVYELNGMLYMLAPSGVTVVHEEHAPVTLPAGSYQIGTVQEYDHFAEEARFVRD